MFKRLIATIIKRVDMPLIGRNAFQRSCARYNSGSPVSNLGNGSSKHWGQFELYKE